MINIAHPIIEAEEIKAVNEVLQSGVIAQGPKVAELEDAFAKYCGTKYAVAVSSGTAAIHAALYAAGVREGDEVITTPFSFIGTINPILMLGAKPVFVDINAKTYNINTSLIEAKITNKTKAILPVHLYGQPCDFDELKAVANEHGLKIIEDACQAIGANYKSKKVGSLGDLGCFSLYATKNIMCGEGGVITTNDKTYVEIIRQFRQHGMTAPYQYTELGYNYRMTDLQAAIAIEQLKKVDIFTKARQYNAHILNEGIKANNIRLPVVGKDRTHVYHQYTLAIKGSRDTVLEFLRERNIGAGVYYPKSLHEYPHIAALGYKLSDFPVAVKAAASVVSLPVHPRVSKKDLQTIITAVNESANA